MSFTAVRCVSPQLFPVEGGAALPGRARWQFAFTTTATHQGADGSGQLHRGDFWTDINLKSPTSPVQWRLESQPLHAAQDSVARIVEGEAPGLDHALNAAISAACRGAEMLLAPAFIALQRTPHAPRIWGCSALYQQMAMTGAKPTTFSQTCFIREFTDTRGAVFICTLETEEGTLHTYQHWRTRDLSTAIAHCENELLIARTDARPVQR
jgi:hypothetical protein